MAVYASGLPPPENGTPFPSASDLKQRIEDFGRVGENYSEAQDIALLMLDIDHFKRFNDTFGHQAGDALLRALGILLKETTRGQDVVCRYGGEEFAFVLAGASLDAARKRAELLREEMKQLNVRHGGQLLGSVTLSVGIAVFPDNGESAELLLKAADDALYRAKENGRDTIICA